MKIYNLLIAMFLLISCNSSHKLKNTSKAKSDSLQLSKVVKSNTDNLSDNKKSDSLSVKKSDSKGTRTIQTNNLITTDKTASFTTITTTLFDSTGHKKSQTTTTKGIIHTMQQEQDKQQSTEATNKKTIDSTAKSGSDSLKHSITSKSDSTGKTDVKKKAEVVSINKTSSRASWIIFIVLGLGVIGGIWLFFYFKKTKA